MAHVCAHVALHVDALVCVAPNVHADVAGIIIRHQQWVFCVDGLAVVTAPAVLPIVPDKLPQWDMPDMETGPLRAFQLTELVAGVSAVAVAAAFVPKQRNNPVV
ncbi:MAG: hypothetical protein K2L95_02360 [Alphaproteobacteria bacterium]|nr:hypothetical protein [Alphaproteobacteria bacterium]